GFFCSIKKDALTLCEMHRLVHYRNNIIAGTVIMDRRVVTKTIFEASSSSRLYWAAKRAVVAPAGMEDMIVRTPISVSSNLSALLTIKTAKGIRSKRIAV